MQLAAGRLLIYFLNGPGNEAEFPLIDCQGVCLLALILVTIDNGN